MVFSSDSVFKTLAYADIFDYPLTAEEIDRFLISGQLVNQKKVQEKLFFLKKKKKIGEKKGFYFLKGREKTVLIRKNRQKWSQEKLKTGQRWAGFLKPIPWIKAVLITGALARRNADEKDDIDWLVITQKNRLWLSRFFSLLVLEILGVRRRPGQNQAENKICPNMFLTESSLGLPKQEQGLYAACEILQAELIWEKNQTYSRFIKANQWVKKYLGNAYAWRLNQAGDRIRESKRFQQRDWLAKPFFDFWERLAFKLQRGYMKSKKTREIVEGERALFHPQDARVWVMRKYQEKTQK
jgi:hypothetical protein